MGLFRRKPKKAEAFVTKLCPYCKEPLRNSATTCVMCGTDLPEVVAASSAPAKEPSGRSS